MSNTDTAARDFDSAMESFLDFAQSLVSDGEGPDYPENCRSVLFFTKGRKYARIVKTGIAADSTRQSVYCFVEMATGNILKADSWKRPAKGVRGNIFNSSRDSAVTGYGAVYFG